MGEPPKLQSNVQTQGHTLASVGSYVCTYLNTLRVLAEGESSTTLEALEPEKYSS